MPDLRFSEIEDNNNNIRGSFTQSSDLDSSNTVSRDQLNIDSPKNPLKRTHITDPVDQAPLEPGCSQNSIFGIISQNESNSYKPFENGSGSSVENGGTGTTNHGEQDLAYYDWPAIDNFEDVDRLFRNCDSTFGQTQMMEEEEGEKELSWFANGSDAIYTSEMEVLNNDSSNSTQIEDNGHTWQDSSVEEIMQELIDQKCTLVGPSEPSFSPFGQNQRQQLESGPSSYVTFNSYSGTQSSAAPVETTRQRTPGGKELETMKSGQLMNSCQHPLTLKAPSSHGPIRKSHFERVSGEQKGMIDSSVNNLLSVEETSFRQLQDVMNQLDEKTKICIRDSLYRLARSVQQRTTCHNANSSNGDAQRWSDTNNMFAEPTGNLESETNPVDRSIAELLFHHPSNTVTGTNEDSMSLKSSISVSYFVNT